MGRESSSNRCAFLGPPGSYSSEALATRFPEFSPLPVATISKALSELAKGRVEFALLPIENSIQGFVTETLDSLFLAPDHIKIATAVSLEIAHALGAKEQISLEKISKVSSHPQALRQCGRFLSSQLPEARLVEMSSTATAADELAKSTESSAAVIASVQALQNAGLKILRRGISDSLRNSTRFVLLHSVGSSSKQSAVHTDGNSQPDICSIAIYPGADRKGLLFDILDILSARHQLNVVSIHSRPAPSGSCFIFYLDLEVPGGESRRLEDALAALERFCSDKLQRVESGYIKRFGTYPREEFRKPLLQTAGIVGAEGAMGNWFSGFFRQNGIRVLANDVSGGTPLKELAEKSDIIVLSVAAQQIEHVARDLAPHLSESALIVENCSVKGTVPEVLREIFGSAVEVLSIHTLFGGHLESLRDQTVLLPSNGEAQPSEKALFFQDLFYKHGAKLLKVKKEQHDTSTAQTQAMLHLLLLACGASFREHFSEARLLREFSTPNLESVLESLERFARIAPQVAVDIQLENPSAAKERNTLLQKLLELTVGLNSGESGEFVDELARLKEFFAELPRG